MVFNGLSKSDLVVFNALNECDLAEPLPISTLARLTCYHARTIGTTLQRLEEMGIITRHRASLGQPYTYNIKKNGYVVFNP